MPTEHLLPDLETDRSVLGPHGLVGVGHLRVGRSGPCGGSSWLLLDSRVLEDRGCCGLGRVGGGRRGRGGGELGDDPVKERVGLGLVDRFLFEGVKKDMSKCVSGRKKGGGKHAAYVVL